MESFFRLPQRLYFIMHVREPMFFWNFHLTNQQRLLKRLYQKRDWTSLRGGKKCTVCRSPHFSSFQINTVTFVSTQLIWSASTTWKRLSLTEWLIGSLYPTETFTRCVFISLSFESNGLAVGNEIDIIVGTHIVHVDGVA